MNRLELQQISKLRLKESALLLRHGYSQGAYYLAGYSVECALKACIAKQTKKYEFPDKNIVTKAWCHDLNQLVTVAGIKHSLDSDISTNSKLGIYWAVVSNWNETVRYQFNISPNDARDLYIACSDKTNGIFTWIKQRW